MDQGMLRGLIAVATLLVFLGICWWAYRPGNRKRFEEDGWMVFDPDEADHIKANSEARQQGDRA